MSTRGAKYLALLSRSGAVGEDARAFVEELHKLGVTVATPSCDISDEASVRQTLSQLSKTMPPIKGCIQSSMVLKVRKMSPIPRSGAKWRKTSWLTIYITLVNHKTCAIPLRGIVHTSAV